METKKILITGAAGFIGFHLSKRLLKDGWNVYGLDNLNAYYDVKLKEDRLEILHGYDAFSFHKLDLADKDKVQALFDTVEIPYVVNLAAQAGVRYSLKDPYAYTRSNIDGFLNMLVAARDACVKRFVYAASSSTYGDHPDLPKEEDKIGKPLSPYAVTKLVNELYGEVFSRVYDFNTIGLRYFNIFGQRQDPDGAYAAVIPKWFAGLLIEEPIFINGDGETSRDFCFIENCVQANILAATVETKQALNQVYNIAFGESTNLNTLFELIRERINNKLPGTLEAKPIYRDFRSGDVRHSLADINKAKQLLGYSPEYSVRGGLDKATDWYLNRFMSI